MKQGFSVETYLVCSNNSSVLQPDAILFFIFKLKTNNHYAFLNKQDLIDIFIFPEVNSALFFNPGLEIA